MVINITTTTISFYPFIDFDGLTDVSVQVWHKNTKTMVSDNSGIVAQGSRITLDLPSLTNIADVAQDLDVCLIRVFDEDTLLWEYLATWSNESTNINKSFKNWDTTSNISPQWITL
jgi:hypothetical protein